MNLLWNSNRKRKDPLDGPTVIEILASDGPNFTGTEIFADRVAQLTYRGTPIEFDFYGSHVTVSGFTAEGELRYEVKPTGEATPMNLVFRGYVIHIIGY